MMTISQYEDDGTDSPGNVTEETDGNDSTDSPGYTTKENIPYYSEDEDEFRG